MLPRTISPVCRHLATSAHCDSFTVWPTRSWSTSVGRLFGRIWPRTTSSGSVPSSPSPAPEPGPAEGTRSFPLMLLECTGTSNKRSEK